MLDLNIFNKFRYSQIIFIGLLPAILVNIAFFSWLVREDRIRAQSSSAAGLEENIATGISSAEIPAIEGVKPYYGKAGDEVVIWGRGFGYYPDNSYIFLENFKVTKYTKWVDNEIIFELPDNSESGEIKIVLDGREVFWDKIFTVYDLDTISNIKYENGFVHLTNFDSLGQVKIWEGFDSEANVMTGISTGPETLVPSSSKPLWIEIRNKDNKPAAFYESTVDL